METSVKTERRSKDDWSLTLCGTALVSTLMTAFLLVDQQPASVTGLDMVLGTTDEGWPMDGEIIAMDLSADLPVYAEMENPARPVLAVLVPPPAEGAFARPRPLGHVRSAIEIASLDAPEPAGLELAALPQNEVEIARMEQAEEALSLSKGQRAVVQRRLVLAGHDPNGVDGIFGDGTRKAVAELQAAESLPETGYLDPETLDVLTAKTDQAYAAWRAERAKARRNRTQVAKVEVPPQRPSAKPPRQTKQTGCARDGDGRIIGHQGFVCDLSGLGESIISFDLPPGDGGDARFAEAARRYDR